MNKKDTCTKSKFGKVANKYKHPINSKKQRVKIISLNSFMCLRVLKGFIFGLFIQV